MNLKLIIVELCLPVVICLGLVLAVPHVIAKSIVPAFGTLIFLRTFQVHIVVISFTSTAAQKTDTKFSVRLPLGKILLHWPDVAVSTDDVCNQYLYLCCIKLDI